MGWVVLGGIMTQTKDQAMMQTQMGDVIDVWWMDDADQAMEILVDGKCLFTQGAYFLGFH